MLVYDRKLKTSVNEPEYKQEVLQFLYGSKIGRILLKTIFARPWFSKLYGLYISSPLSKGKIRKFQTLYGIKDGKKYKSFNDFFTRNLTFETASKENELISPADAKLCVYRIADNTKLRIKNSVYSIDELTGIKNTDFEYALVFRLSVENCHRYIFFDDGRTLLQKRIKGMLHTIREFEDGVYCKNSRFVTLMDTKHFGRAIQTEVGAMLIGKINNHNKKTFSRYVEKGYFEYGGSTIVLLINNIRPDEDILKNSAAGIETRVHIGERIGERI